MIDFIICLGNGSESADNLAKNIATSNNLTHLGFLDNFTELLPGCYHTSIYDITLLELTAKISSVDCLKIVVLDQDKSFYKNSREYHDTIEMAQALMDYHKVEFVNPSMTNTVRQSLEENKSFCITIYINT